VSFGTQLMIGMDVGISVVSEFIKFIKWFDLLGSSRTEFYFWHQQDLLWKVKLVFVKIMHFCHLLQWFSTDLAMGPTFTQRSVMA